MYSLHQRSQEHGAIRQLVNPGKGQEIEDSLAFMVQDCIKRLAELWESVETQSIEDN